MKHYNWNSLLCELVALSDIYGTHPAIIEYPFPSEVDCMKCQKNVSRMLVFDKLEKIK